MTQTKTQEALKLAIELLEDDLATLTREQAADYKERYAGGYKPERVKYANDLVVRTEKLIEACKAALAEQQKPLSDDEIKIMAEQLKQSVFGFPENIIWLARAIERAHGIGE